MTGAARTHGFSNKKSKLFSRAAYTHHLPRDPQESDLKANLKLLQIGDVNIDDDKIDFPPRNVLNLDLHRKLKLAQDRPIAIISIAERDFEAGSQFEALDCWSADQAGRIYNLLAEKCLSINCVPLLMYNTPSQLFAADVLSYSKSNKWLDFCTDSLQEVRELIQHGSIVISESELDGCIANATGTPFVRWPQSNEGYEVNEEMLLSFWPCITTLVSRKKDFSRYNSPNNRNAA